MVPSLCRQGYSGAFPLCLWWHGLLWLLLFRLFIVHNIATSLLRAMVEGEFAGTKGLVVGKRALVCQRKLLRAAGIGGNFTGAITDTLDPGTGKRCPRCLVRVHTLSLPHVVSPSTLVCISIDIFVRALTRAHIISPGTRVNTAVRIVKGALTILLALFIIPVVLGAALAKDVNAL